MEVQPGVVTVLADTALRASDIDEAAAAQAQEGVECALSESAAELDYGRLQAQLAAATATTNLGGAAQAAAVKGDACHVSGLPA